MIKEFLNQLSKIIHIHTNLLRYNQINVTLQLCQHINSKLNGGELLPEETFS